MEGSDMNDGERKKEKKRGKEIKGIGRISCREEDRIREIKPMVNLTMEKVDQEMEIGENNLKIQNNKMNDIN